ncbi:MAG: hypothetical protein H6Q90_3746 [Deltaproteobacteria bacterium]|nr:hypothetical protein [Deltaproteobacteria bacterium]
MRNLVLGAALALAALGGCHSDKTADLPTMTVEQVDVAVTANQAQAVDCNGEATRKKWGIVPGALLICDDEFFTASQLPANKAAKLVFYCVGPG